MSLLAFFLLIAAMAIIYFGITKMGLPPMAMIIIGVAFSLIILYAVAALFGVVPPIHFRLT